VPKDCNDTSDDEKKENSENITNCDETITTETPHHQIVDQHHEKVLANDLDLDENNFVDDTSCNQNEKDHVKEGTLVDENHSTKGSKKSICDQGSQTCYLVMRICPTKRNQLSIYSNKYLSDENFPPKDTAPESELRKRFIVAEVRDKNAFLHLLNSMKKNEMLQSFLIGGEVTFDDIHEKVLSLNPKKKQKTAKASTFVSKYDPNDTILVFPFHAQDTELQSASRGLTEAGGKLSSCESSTIFTNDTDASTSAPCKNQPASKVHTITIRGEDYDRLNPGEFLNDTLIDFWISW
jgi:Ulp1 family protease